MNQGFSQMSTPPAGTPPPGYGGPPPGYGMAPPPKKNNTATVIIIVLAAVFGGGIFVVAILAAILFPVFAKVRGNARRVACMSNVKQIDLGLFQYEQNHRGKLPTGDYKAALTPYLHSEAVFRCPADSGSGGDSYSFNPNLQSAILAKLTDPHNTVAIYEGKNQALDFRHEGRAVVGFADGSVRSVPPSQAQNLQWQP